MEYFIHGANVLYLLSYLVRDILWLRILTVVGASTLLPYFYFQPTPLWSAIYWNMAFTLLNICWIVRLIYERRPVKLTGNDLRLYQLVFRCLTPREMRKLLKLGRWEEAQPGQCFIAKGQTLDRLMVICAGKAEVMQHNESVDELGAGQFIGGISFITEESAPADVVAVETTYYMSWPKATLKKFLGENPELQAALHLTLGFDLSKRLQAVYAA